ncbi:polyphosphate polymerase domain-containing protein [Actinomyces bowdenii]|uniref:polyphosphate polymerase domain-containing protein n=1 Tax=Actinomyces bowdenii TaxID=131109 RepID=UPI00214A8BAC|nr:polyphosphate polymerase domain-containing protein [Actinomyces bowdenii]MCR2052583.1 polyphosphate polymerase domain-containing protein [Actinomyces bowdenii]
MTRPAAPIPGPARPASPQSAPAALSAQHLPATTLERLEAAAGLLTRVDRKYLLPIASTQELIDALANRAHVLQIEGRRSFSYASTYFDTPGLESYMRAARKRHHRFKVRTRTYLDSDLCFLEVKTQGSRESTVKTRIAYSPGDSSRITEEGRDFVASCLTGLGVVEEQAAQRIAESLAPVLATTYQRCTLHLPDDGARATIDTDLTWRRLTRSTWRTEPGRSALPSRRSPTAEPGAPVRLSGCAVVETKNPAGPSPTDRLLWSAGHRPARISKYATGLALIHPELPANRWHRLLNRDLTDLTGMARLDALAASA